LRVGYGDTEIVSGFTLSCRPGEIVALIGPNGCGKSTLLKGLCGLLTPLGGMTLVGGRDTTHLPAADISGLGVQYVPQIHDVFPSLTVEENLFVGVADVGRASDVLTMFPVLESLLKRKAGRLSGGERKALAIARSFMNPDVGVLMLDEPSVGLSPVATGTLWPAIKNAAELGIGVIVVEQRVDDVLAISDRAYVMVDGKNRMDAHSSELLSRRNELGQMFMGA
jgi:ABC-type branched-subunit amino acid transport system ATPase component